MCLSIRFLSGVHHCVPPPVSRITSSCVPKHHHRRCVPKDKVRSSLGKRHCLNHGKGDVFVRRPGFTFAGICEGSFAPPLEVHATTFSSRRRMWSRCLGCSLSRTWEHTSFWS